MSCFPSILPAEWGDRVGFWNDPGSCIAYAASKAAMINFTQALAIYGLAINAYITGQTLMADGGRILKH